MKAFFWALLGCLPMTVLAQSACVITAHDEQMSVKLCQENRTIPEALFANGFCQPELPDQQVEITLAEQCPQGAYGVCRHAQVQGVAYQQDIYYYGEHDSDARFLQPACEQMNKGQWEPLERIQGAQ